MTSTSKKQKIENEHQKSNSEWTHKYLCIEKHVVIKCLDSQQTVSCAKEHNVKCHYLIHEKIIT